MARFRDEWTDPVDQTNGINRGQQYNALSDNMSVDDVNKMVNNLIHLKNRIVDGTGTILTLGGEKVASMEVDSTPQESGTNRLVTSAGVANALKNFTPSGGNEYDDTELRELIDGKVDKVTGKGLSTNDYTNEEKTKLAGLENYDDTELRGLINNKANLDASNLSTTDVDKWKSKLGVGQSTGGTSVKFAYNSELPIDGVYRCSGGKDASINSFTITNGVVSAYTVGTSFDNFASDTIGGVQYDPSTYTLGITYGSLEFRSVTYDYVTKNFIGIIKLANTNTDYEEAVGYHL